MSGSKIYGSRWAVVPGPRLGSGGQSEVFRATDITKQVDGEFALKRVFNAKRQQRFRREIDAIKRLDHPNIIKLIDHSALEESAGSDHQFLVMPIAQGGDLSRPDRLKLYEGSIDSVLQSARQIADALKAAHAKNIIHRDVKPANILFTGIGPEIWLTDFGICLIREESRITEPPEAVGPRAFMAPELEGGGQLEVTPAADIYSFGKLIYFMITGGRILPRERLSEEEYRRPFDGGERYHLLELLLNRMICLLPRRIKSMSDVIIALDEISAWERTALALPITSVSLSAIETFQRRSLENARTIADNAAARDSETQSLESVKSTFTTWAKGQLELAAAHIATETIHCEAKDAKMDLSLVATGTNTGYRILSGAEFELQDRIREATRKHVFQILLAQRHQSIVTTRVSIVGQSNSPPTVSAQPITDADLGVIFVYKFTVTNSSSEQPLQIAYLTEKVKIGSVQTFFDRPAVRRQAPRPGGVQRHQQVLAVMPQFQLHFSLHKNFKASEWPQNQGDLRSVLAEAVEVFIEYLSTRL
jgi:serine/threonine protein kinase